MREVSYPENLHRLFQNKKMPHAIVVESNNTERAYEEIIQMVKVLNCKKGGEKACGSCESCIKIAAGSHPDLKTISLDKDSKYIKIDSIRFIRQDANVLPNEGDFKVYIIKFADCMTVQAQNAFIKILEEPPRGVIFILLCESVNSLISTIISRCGIFIDKRPNFEEAKDPEFDSLAKEITQASIQNDKVKILKIISRLEPDRAYIQKLVNKIREVYLENLRVYPQRVDDILEKLENLKIILDAFETNVGLNVILGNLAAML